jgi:hypothetical protein
MTCEIPLYRCENTLRRFTSPSPPLSCRGGFPYPSRLHPLRVVYLHDPVRLTEVCHAASGPVPPGCPRAVYPTQSCPAAAVDPPPPRSTAPVAAVFLVEPFRATTRRRWSRRLHRSRTSLFVTRRFASPPRSFPRLGGWPGPIWPRRFVLPHSARLRRAGLSHRSRPDPGGWSCRPHSALPGGELSPIRSTSTTAVHHD